jgi:hypothetical protein
MRWILAAVALVLLAAAVVLFARWLRGLEPVAEFIESYPGSYPLPAGAPVSSTSVTCATTNATK